MGLLAFRPYRRFSIADALLRMRRLRLAAEHFMEKRAEDMRHDDEAKKCEEHEAARLKDASEKQKVGRPAVRQRGTQAGVRCPRDCADG